LPDLQFPSADADVKLIAELKSKGDAAVAAAFEKTIWPKFISAVEGAGGPRFAIVDFALVVGEGRITRTLTSISWCPDKGVTAKQKMTFASTRTAFEAKINIGKKYPANDLSDLEYSAVKDAVGSGK